MNLLVAAGSIPAAANAFNNQILTRSSLLVAVSSHLAAASSIDFQETLGFPQYKQHTISSALL